MTKGDRIRTARERKGITQEELGRMCGTTKQTIFKYESGTITNIPLDRVEKIAEILDIAPSYITGWDKPPFSESSDDLPSNVTPLPPMDKIPLVGKIACGTPILAEQNIEEYIDLPRHIQADFALGCQGDSMVGAGIQDGDMVYIKAQPEVENGQIAAVLVDGSEATLKRFYFDGKSIQLLAENSRFPPMVYVGEEMNRVRVVGRAVAYTHAMRE